MFFIVSGSSGCGKNTIINELLKTNKKLKLLPTLTTREKREGESEGNPFYYVTKEEFQDKIRKNELLEHELIHNNFYGASKVLLNDFLEHGHYLIKDIGVKGTFNLDEKLQDVTPVVKIFFTTNGKRSLKKRLIGRGEKQIKLRLSRYGFEQKQKNRYDYIIHNEDKQYTIDIMNVLIKIGEKYNQILPTKPFAKINNKKIKKYIEKFLTKQKVKPVKVSLQNEKIYLLNGHERFIASILTHSTLTKKFVVKAPKILNENDYAEFNKLLKTKI